MLKIKDLHVSYGGIKALRGVDLEVPDGKIVTLIGANGAGKSTTLRTISGLVKAESGSITYDGKELLGLSINKILEQGIAQSPEGRRVFPNLTVLENLKIGAYLRKDRDGIEKDVRWIYELFPRLEERHWQPAGTLSGGEQSKLLLAMLFSRENRFLLIDEPTNHLDQVGRALVSRYLRGKKGFLLVSHDRAFLDGCVDHILSINRSSIEVRKGNFSSWYENKRRQDAFELSQNERLKKEIGRLKEAARQSSAWADRGEETKIGKNSAKVKGLADAMGGRDFVAEQSRRMQQRRKNLERRQQNAIEEKSALLKDIERSDALKLHPLAHHAQRLAALRDVSIDYGGGAVCSGVSFTVTQGDRVALCGANGCGKSSILKLLCGQDIPYSGTLETASRLVISYVPQDASGLRGGLRDYAAGYGLDESLFLTILRKLGFERVQFEKDMGDYSAGQKKKVLLARSLCQSAHLYVWDEPLNYIDVLSRIQIEELLQAFRPTLLFVEHDRVFCEKIATKVVEM